MRMGNFEVSGLISKSDLKTAVLVPYKWEETPINNEGRRVLIIFSPFYVYGSICCGGGNQLHIRSDPPPF